MYVLFWYWNFRRYIIFNVNKDPLNIIALLIGNFDYIFETLEFVDMIY